MDVEVEMDVDVNGAVGEIRVQSYWGGKVHEWVVTWVVLHGG